MLSVVTASMPMSCAKKSLKGSSIFRAVWEQLAKERTYGGTFTPTSTNNMGVNMPATLNKISDTRIHTELQIMPVALCTLHENFYKIIAA
jgi:hypothetical protein